MLHSLVSHGRRAVAAAVRSATPPVHRPAMTEALESRRLMSATVASYHLGSGWSDGPMTVTWEKMASGGQPQPITE